MLLIVILRLKKASSFILNDKYIHKQVNVSDDLIISEIGRQVREKLYLHI